MEIIDAHVHSLACGIMCGGQVDVRYKTVKEGLKGYRQSCFCSY
ncbi:hypothetical protein [Caloranaerobacter azorensis]|nr:hypothetical protein [Caloranaerobacter azorensis]